MACLVTMELLAVMDATEPKGNGAVRGGLGPWDHQAQRVRKEIRERLELRALRDKKGQRGEKGEIGTLGSPQLSSHMNWKECTWKKGDGKDSGVIQASDLYYFSPASRKPDNGIVIFRA